MLSALLRSGNLKDYTVLGQDGIAVHSVASQLRNTIKLKRGKVFADYLAIPQSNEQGSQIDWYVPFDSTNSDGKYFIVPWSAATNEERSKALAELQLFERSMLELGQEMGAVNEVKGDQRLFARLLCSTGSNDVENGSNLTALRFPSSDYVYIVNGRPVITFWGFSEKNIPLSGSPFLPLRPAIAAEPNPIPQSIPQAAPIVANHNKCKRFWWILPLLLALALLLFFLRGCVPSMGLPSLGAPSSNNPSVETPATNADEAKEDEKEEPKEDVLAEPIPEYSAMHNGQKYGFLNGKWFDDKGNEVTDAALLDGLNANIPAEGNAGEGQANPEEASSEQANPEEAAPNEDKSAEDKSAEDKSAEDKSAEDKSTEDKTAEDKATDDKPDEAKSDEKSKDVNSNNQPVPNPNIANQKAGNKLNIPPKSLKNGGSVDFLNGTWNAGAGIQDKTTGKPLRLNYQFKNGTGKVRLNRGDGVECVGDVSAAINNGGLNINNAGTAKCSDGTSYKLPQVRCNGSGGDTDCKGEYQQGSSFPMSIKN